MQDLVNVGPFCSLNSFILFTILLSSRILEKADILLDNKYTTFNHLHLDLV